MENIREMVFKSKKRKIFQQYASVTGILEY